MVGNNVLFNHFGAAPLPSLAFTPSGVQVQPLKTRPGMAAKAGERTVIGEYLGLLVANNVTIPFWGIDYFTLVIVNIGSGNA